MKNRFTILMIFLISPTVASESSCLSITDNKKRLSCYDKEFGFKPDKKPPIKGKGRWQIYDEISKIDDSKNIFLLLESFEQTNCPYKDGKHELMIACRENKTSLYFKFADCFMSDNSGRGEITYRIDKKPARTIRLRESSNNMALGLWSGGVSIPFVKKLFEGSNLFIKATPFSDSAVTAEYKISGIENAILPLRESCNW